MQENTQDTRGGCTKTDKTDFNRNLLQKMKEITS